MKILYDILLIYAGAFLIGMLVAGIIWLLVHTMSPQVKKKRRESFQEMKQIK